MTTAQPATEKDYVEGLAFVIASMVARYCYGDDQWRVLDPEERAAVAEPYLRWTRSYVPMFGEGLRELARDAHARAVMSKAWREAGLANAAEALHALADDMSTPPGQPCACGSPETYALNPTEVVAHTPDGCTIERAEQRSEP